MRVGALNTTINLNALCQVWLKMAQWFWRRRILKVFNVFLLFHNYLPFEKGMALHLKKLESPSPKNALCQVWLKLAHWFWRRRFFKVVNLFLGHLSNSGDLLLWVGVRRLSSIVLCPLTSSSQELLG